MERLFVYWVGLICLCISVFWSWRQTNLGESTFLLGFLAVAGLYILQRTYSQLGDLLRFKAAVLTIDREGVLDLRLCPKKIPWSEIVDCWKPGRFGEIVYLRLKTPSNFIAPVDRLRRLTMALRAQMGLISHIIDVRVLDTDGATIEKAINQRRKAHSGSGLETPPFPTPN